MLATSRSQVLQSKSGMLVAVPKRFYEMQRLHVYDKGTRNSVSGIQATMFGGTGSLGSMLGANLTLIGSQCIYPYRTLASQWDKNLRELKTTADLGNKQFMQLQDFTSAQECGFAMKNSNVVINCIGSAVWRTQESDFEEANIRVPMAIAKAARDSKHVKRFIHISAAGADPNSQSLRLRTKWIGEQEVKAIYPDVTILRPTLTMNTHNANPTIAGKWSMQQKMFNRMNWLIAGQNAKVQPVFVQDVCLAVLNCLKMEETIGQSYDLGGPHTYDYHEIYRMFYEITQIKPYTNLVKFEDAFEYYHTEWYASFYRQLFRTWLNPEFMTQEDQELIVNPDNKGFADLHIMPVAFGAKAHELVNDVYWLYNNHTDNKRDNANN